MARVFLSHAGSDKPAVRRIATALRAAGHDTWLDEDDILVGESIPAAVERALRDADFVVLCLSRAAAERGWVEAERDATLMQQFRERKERILPVRLEDVARPHLVAAIAYVDLFPNEQAFKHGMTRLTRSIEAHQARHTGVALLPESVRAPLLPLPVSKPIPAYPNAEVEALSKRLEAARARRDKLRTAGIAANEVDREILELRRELREGGQLRPGDAVGDGRYLLVKVVGRGGFAVVWEAYDGAAEQRVAVKVLHANLAGDPQRRERFFRGAQAMMRLTHPAVVRVLESKGEDGGYYYYVMEFVSGGNLREAVLALRVKRDHVLRLILQVGEALAQAHSMGMIHRDIKPANILLDERGNAKLTDFDLVGARDTTGGTRTGAMGTVVYAAPECLQKPQEATARADVFGLGMTAIFCLSGQDLTMDTLVDRAGALGQLNCTVSVRKVLERAVEWKPDRRFADAAALVGALRDALMPIVIGLVPGTIGPRAVDLGDDYHGQWAADYYDATRIVGETVGDIEPAPGAAPVAAAPTGDAIEVAPNRASASEPKRSPVAPPPDTVDHDPMGAVIREMFKNRKLTHGPGGLIEVDGKQIQLTTTQSVLMASLGRTAGERYQAELVASQLGRDEFAIGTATLGEALVGTVDARPALDERTEQTATAGSELEADVEELGVQVDVEELGVQEDVEVRELQADVEVGAPAGTAREGTDERIGEVDKPLRSAVVPASSVPVPTGSPADRWLTNDDDAVLRVEERPIWAAHSGHDRYGLWAAFEVSGVQQRMRWIPPGRFLMGSPPKEAGRRDNEGPQHWVTITRGYWLGETPVTQALWRAVMTTNPSQFVSDDRPVEMVSWDDCQTFIGRLNERIEGLETRLPTEAEWERACRAGTTTTTWVGDLTLRGENDAPELDAIAWYGGNSGVGFELDNGYDSSDWREKQHPHTRAGTHPVGRKAPNPHGLHDMLGNVFQWCQDAAGNFHGHTYASEPVVDPVPRGKGPDRVYRGGSWSGAAKDARAAYRRAYIRDGRVVILGFRLAGDEASAPSKSSKSEGEPRSSDRGREAGLDAPEATPPSALRLPRRSAADYYDAARMVGEMVGEIESVPGASSVAAAATGEAIEVAPERATAGEPERPLVAPPPQTASQQPGDTRQSLARRWALAAFVLLLFAMAVFGAIGVVATGPDVRKPVVDSRVRLAADAGIAAMDAAVAQSVPGAAAGCPDDMVVVSAGTFRMGGPSTDRYRDEQPPHEVILSGYCIDRTEVTVKAYTACVRAGRCTAAGEPEKTGMNSACNGTRTDRQDHPINCVDWEQARAYCAWMRRRLPTEAEWEFAARGRDMLIYPWGKDWSTADRLNVCLAECWRWLKHNVNDHIPLGPAMYGEGDGWETTAPVANFHAGASPFGAEDMAGNVSEWTADWFDQYSDRSVVNPQGPDTGTERVIRGGSWSDNGAIDFRGANRQRDYPTSRVSTVGFRCVRAN